VHIDGASRAEALRDRLIELLGELPGGLRRSLTWDQGSEMPYHHEIAHATAMPVFLCHPGRPWERPSNENTNGLLRDYFPKGSDLRVHTALDLKRVAANSPPAPQDPQLAEPRPPLRYSPGEARVATSGGARRAALGSFGERRHFDASEASPRLRHLAERTGLRRLLLDD
jgi:hypothetical protein